MSAVLAALFAGDVHAQQVSDPGFQPRISRPAFRAGKGPRVCVDEAHRNFHTLGGKFQPFGLLVLLDGYRLRSATKQFDAAELAKCDLLVIANAAPETGSLADPPHPTPPAFSPQEIAAVHEWVQRGGDLLLIADHMPFGGASAGLASTFGVEFTDGFAMREPESDAPDVFRIEDRTLSGHAITRGRSKSEAVNRVWTFTGQAFRAPKAQPLLVFPDGYVLLMPDKPWEFSTATPRTPIQGWLQGAALTTGKGRAAFFGEAAMFSAQLVGPDRERIGMNTPGAEGNVQFVLNVVHWLTRVM